MDIFTDVVHVEQAGREVIAEEIVRRLESNRKFLDCLDQVSSSGARTRPATT